MGPRCHCGNLGCVEAMAAGPAITRMAIEAAEAGHSPVLAECLRANGTIPAHGVWQAGLIGAGVLAMQETRKVRAVAP